MVKQWIFITLTATLLTACVPGQISTPSPSSPTENTITEILEGLPVFPGAIRSDIASHHYTIENADIEAVQRFYKRQMQADGWELLGVGDMSGADIGKAYALWFVKDQAIISIDVFSKENKIQAIITLSDL